MILITSYYESPYSDRQEEIDECLLKNINNKYISRIYFLNDKIYDISSITNSDKVVQIDIGKRIKYEDAISYANKFPGEICIIANSDIYYDDSLSLLEKINWEKLFLAISRYEHDDTIAHFRHCRVSQDTWIFKSPAMIDEKECNFNFGIPACDNRIAHIFHSNGYKVINPYGEIITHHLHKSNIRTYSSNQKVPGLAYYVDKTNLPL